MGDALADAAECRKAVQPTASGNEEVRAGRRFDEPGHRPLLRPLKIFDLAQPLPPDRLASGCCKRAKGHAEPVGQLPAYVECAA